MGHDKNFAVPERTWAPSTYRASRDSVIALSALGSIFCSVSLPVITYRVFISWTFKSPIRIHGLLDYVAPLSWPLVFLSLNSYME